MKFYEKDAKKIFKKEGIRILNSEAAYSPEEAKKIATEFNEPVVVKSQVLTGGRGKLGGICFANTPEEALDAAKKLLGFEIKGEKVTHLLIEQKANILKEFFISITIDRSAKKPIIMASAEGGMDIEELAKTKPEKIIRYHVDPLNEFLPFEAREIARKMGVESKLIQGIGDIIWKLYNIFDKYDCQTAEINPLALTPDGLIAADAKLEIENDALFRHKDLVEEMHFKSKDVSFVELDGDIAVLGNGAGLTLTGMDMIKLYGGKPATFLDIGGGSSEEVIKKSLKLVMNYPPVKVIFLNVLGGITRADDVAKGVVNALNEIDNDIPIVIRLTGTNEKEGQKILEDAGIPFETSMEKAAEKAVKICESLK